MSEAKEQEVLKHDGKTLQEVQSEYGIACAQLGDLVVRSEQMDRDITGTKFRIEKLIRTAKKFNKQGPVSVPQPAEQSEEEASASLDA